MAKYLIRKIKLRSGRRIGKFTPITARNKKEALLKFEFGMRRRVKKGVNNLLKI